MEEEVNTNKEYEPTNSIDIYFSKEEIEKEYTIMGHAVASSSTMTSNDKVQNKLIEEAKSKGADAILITGVGKSSSSTGYVYTEENQLNVSFIKYK